MPSCAGVGRLRVGTTRTLALDRTEPLESHYSAGEAFDSDVERTLTDKWERIPTEWKLVREEDVLDLGDEVMLSDFAAEHPDGRRAVFEIVGFWTPEYLDAKLSKIRLADVDNLVVAVSVRVDFSEDDFGTMVDCVIWCKTGIHVYNVFEQVEGYALPVAGQSYQRSLHETGVCRSI